MSTINTRAQQSRSYRFRFWLECQFCRFLRLPVPLDVEQALQSMLHKGIGIGMKQQPPIVYHATCPYHEIPLSEIQVGTYVCLLCKSPAFPEYEAQTDPMHALSAQRPLDAFNQARSAGAGVHTAIQQAIPKPEK